MARRVSGRNRFENLLEKPVVDYLGGGLLVGVLLAVNVWWKPIDFLGHLDDAARIDFYGRLIGPLSIVASLATAGLAVYAGASGPNVTLMRQVYGSRVLRQFRSAAVSAGLAVLVLVIGYAAQAGYGFDWFRWVVVGTIAFVALRTARVLYFYSNVLKVIDEDKTPAPARPRLEDQPLRPEHARANRAA